MKISLDILRNFTDLPKELAKVSELFEDVGLEIKKTEEANKDTLLTLELLANRGDHHSYKGVARELSGRTGYLLKDMPSKEVPFSKGNTSFSIDTDDCIAFSLTEFSMTGIPKGDLDASFSHMLSVGEVNEIFPVIDVTNIVNLELGQPAHVYDADKIKGKISVRETEAGEKFKPLFQNQEIELPAGITVIADEEKVLTIGGVIGSEVASVDKDTKRVLFEAALFDPVKVRKTSKLLGIQTLATTRFERGGDLEVIKRSVDRAAYLYDIIGWSNSSGVDFLQKVKLPERYITLNVKATSDYLDYKLTEQEMTDRLARYGFEASKEQDNIRFKVPMSRIWDVEFDVDLYEELSKSIGYNQLPNEMPVAIIGSPTTQAEQRKEDVDNYLVNEGFFEVFTDSLYSNTHRDKMGIEQDDVLYPHVGITNAAEKGYSMLKNNALVQAVELVEKNIRISNKDIKAYEWTKVFTPDASAENRVCREEKVLWGVVHGNAMPAHFSVKDIKTDPLYVKGLLKGLADAANIDFEFDTEIDEKEQPIAKLLHPLRRMRILTSGGKAIGLFGEVHPKLLFAFGLKTERPCYFQLNVEDLEKMPQRDREYQETSELMPMSRDISVEVPEVYPAGALVKIIKDSQEYPISKVKLTDIYKGEGDKNRKITYSIDYQPQDKPFAAEEVNKWTEAIKQRVQDEISKG